MSTEQQENELPNELPNTFHNKQAGKSGSEASTEIPPSGSTGYNWQQSNATDLSNRFVSENQLTELDLRQSSHLLQSVFDTTLIQMSVLKAVRNSDNRIIDFQIVFMNKELAKETRRTDLVGKYYAEEFPGIRPAGVFDVMLQVMETGVPQRTEYFYSHDGFQKWFSSMFVKMDDSLVATNLDITERKQAEQQQLKHLMLLEKTEELAKTGSWEYDVKSGSFLWSDGMYNLFELAKGSAVTPYIYLDHVVDSDRHIAERLVLALTKTFAPAEEILRISVGERIKTLKIKSAPIHGPHSNVEKILGVDLDLTATIQAEEVLTAQNQQLFRSKELLRKKDEFISIASHELKTPVTSIKAYAEILQQQFEDANDHENAKYLQKMNEQIGKLTSLIKHLLDTTKISLGDIQLFRDHIDLNQLIKERIEELQRMSTKHHLFFDQGDLPLVTADKERIEQVLTNLIVNGIKYSPNGGPITVKSYTDGAFAFVSVIDQGIGIKEESLGKVFDRFFRVDEGSMQLLPGLGLGLYISSEIIRKHGGKISVTSQPGAGSTFTFSLPVSPATA
jgi:signal transduction histidine kinase